MAIITCPECGQHPVSDRAAACPKCGCPISPARATVVAAHSSSESTNPAPTICDSRSAKLDSLEATLKGSAEFPDSSVIVSDSTNLAKVVSDCQEWCEELTILPFVDTRHVDAISRLPNLKSLVLVSPGLNDEALLRIGKLQTLRKLEIHINEARTLASSWIYLKRLSRIEYLRLPVFLFPNDFSDASEQVKKILRLELPRAIIK